MTEVSPQRPRVFLRPGGERRIARGHPWAYSNEIAMDAATKALPPGTLATLHRVDGKPLGVGLFNPHPLIAFRLLDDDPAAIIDAAFLAARLDRALHLRERLYARPFYRLVHAEADGLPGVVIDRFGDDVAVQVSTAGMDLLWPELLAALDQAVAPACVVLRNDAPARALEGLDRDVRVDRGAVPDEGFTVRDGALTFPADPLAGQKTGWFYDQAANRAFVAPLAAGGSALDVFCHTGAFAVAAAAAGAVSVTGIDSSEPALALARRAAAMNGVDDRCAFVRGDAFAELERRADAGERHRLVIADPPAFAKSKKERGGALRGYRKLTRLAAALVESEGFLFVASCSHAVEAEAFAGEVAAGLLRTGRSGRILRAAGAGPDHPAHPQLPESVYLKTLTLQVD